VLVRLRPGLSRVWRGPQTVQIGLTPGRAAVLDGLTPDDARLIEQLNLGLDVRELDAGHVPPGPARGREILGLLAEAGVLLTTRTGRAALARLGTARERLAPDAAAWALSDPDHGDAWQLVEARAGRRVHVVGTGRTANALATCLAAAGVDVSAEQAGTVTPADVCPLGPSQEDLGRSRQQVTGWRIAQARDLPSSRRDASRLPDVVVLVSRSAADAAASVDLHAREIAHLSVVSREADIIVGPLVRPGHGPCLHCLDLHRCDRDPRWAHVLAQLLSAEHQRSAVSTEEVSLSAIAGALAALQVLAELDGRTSPAALGATLEVELPDGLVCHRPWPTHPACACSTLPTRLPPAGLLAGSPVVPPFAPPAPGRAPGARSPHRPATMDT